MVSLEAKWGTVIQDQVDHAKTLSNLMSILTITVMNNHPLNVFRMWALHKEMQDRSNWFQHFNNKLKMVQRYKGSKGTKYVNNVKKSL